MRKSGLFFNCSKSHLPQQNAVDELTPRLFLGPATARQVLEAGISADPARLWGSCCEGAEAADASPALEICQICGVAKQRYA